MKDMECKKHNTMDLFICVYWHCKPQTNANLIFIDSKNVTRIFTTGHRVSEHLSVCKPFAEWFRHKPVLGIFSGSSAHL